MPTIVDFEARSRCDLKKRGGRRYWKDPTSEALVAVLRGTESGEVTTWAPGDPPPHVDVAVGHNGLYFDRFGAERYAVKFYAVRMVTCEMPIPWEGSFGGRPLARKGFRW